MSSSTSTAPAAAVTAAIREAPLKPALVPYLTAGFPSRETFVPLLQKVAAHADVLEVGIPFTDPMADGVTIQRSSQQALAAGTNLQWILEQLRDNPVGTPILLMGYLNPLLAFGLEKLAEQSRAARVCGFIVPDLPFEESTLLTDVLSRAGVGLVQMVTPATPVDRMRRLTEASHGFVYAVTKTGTTGGADSALPTQLTDYLQQVRSVSPLPVCAGFGIRSASDVARIAPVADGVVVGSALVEVVEAGEDPVAFLRGLRD